MKKILKGLSLVFFSFSLGQAIVVDNPWGDIDDVFEKFGELGTKLEESLAFFASRTEQINGLTQKMNDFAIVRDSVKSCITTSYNSLKKSIDDCLTNFSEQKIYYGGQISSIENEIQSLKALTDIQIKNLKDAIVIDQNTYNSLLVQYETLKKMNIDAVDAAIAKLVAAQTKRETVVAQREIFATKLNTFLAKIYAEQGLTSTDLNELKDLICIQE